MPAGGRNMRIKIKMKSHGMESTATRGEGKVNQAHFSFGYILVVNEK